MFKEIITLKATNLLNDSEYLYQYTAGRVLCSTRHNHDFYEVIHIYEGKCVHIVNGVHYTMKTGDTIILNSQDDHFFESQANNTSIISISVKKSEFLKFENLYDFNLNDYKEMIFYVPKYELTGTKFISIEEDASIKKIYYRMLLGKFICFMKLHIENYISDKQTSKISAEFLDAATKMKHLENAREGIDAFVRLSNYSRAQLGRLTKVYLGMTPKEYINDIRLRYAYDYVVYGKENFETISELVGFSSVSHFRNIFRNKYNLSLSQARASSKADEIIHTV